MFDGCWWVVHYCLSILFILRFYAVSVIVLPSNCIEPNQSDWFGGNTCFAQRLFWLSCPQGIVALLLQPFMGYAAVLIFLGFISIIKPSTENRCPSLKSIRHDKQPKQTNLKAWYPNRHPNGDNFIGRLSHYWFG